MTVRIPRNTIAVWRAIKAFGSQRALALSLGVEQTTVSAWGSGDRPVPAERCPQIERLTRTQARAKGDTSLIVTCEQLRPDVEWDVLRMQAEPA
jgi:DNA-binding transcriptional regulator YdaS (Cro superfamily)